MKKKGIQMPSGKSQDKAARSEKKTRQDKRGKGLRFRSRWSAMPEDRRVRIMKVAGLLVGVLAVFTFVSVTSYLFTWKADQSLLTETDMLDTSVSVHNMGGKLGYRWGHFLVGRCLGLGSYALVILLAVIFVRLFFRNRSIGVVKSLVETVSGALLVSVILSFISSLAGPDTIFGGGLGGDCGAEISSLCVNLVGKVVTFILLFVLAVIWLLYASGRFSRWLVTLGERPAGKNVRAAAGASESVTMERHAVDPDVESVAGDIYESHAEDETDGHVVEDIVPGIDFDDDPPFSDGDSVPETSAGTVPVESGFGTPAAGGSVAEGGGDRAAVHEDVAAGEGLEVIQGPDFPDVTKELPRIDTREGLENFRFPPLDLLNDYKDGRYDVAPEELERNNNKIRATLLNYKIQVEKVSACVGPTVTLYKVVPAPGVKVSAIKNLEEDIAIALRIKGVRVVILTDAVGIEVANDRPSIVPLKAMLNDDSFRNSKAELPVAIGYTIMQKVKTFDLADAPHLLVAGATKQGKSVGLNVIITSLLYAKHPSELKFVFIDPKMVEFSAYAKLLKHYLAVMPTAASESDEMDKAIVKHPKQADEILRSLCLEMDERYVLLSKSGVNNLKLYNEKFVNRHLLPTDGHRFLPYIVVVIDEYADLIMSGGMGAESRSQARSITSSIIRLAQKGRAAGIHVIIATQRPSVDVITGLIKTNFPTRIAFRVVTRVDSATILDKPGAEKLIGKGDMLYYAGVDMERVQCALVNMDEINRVTEYIGSQNGFHACCSTPYYLPELQTDDADSGSGGMVDMQNLDPMFEEAAKMVVTYQQGSTSTLQRKLGMGYARAGRVMDQLEAAGIVGPQEGSKPRQVLVSDLGELDDILKAYMK